MGWMNRKEEELPAKLKGKTPEQVAEELERLEKEREEQKAAAEKERDDTKAQLSEFEKMKARLQELEASHREPEPQPQPPNQNQPADWLTDPDAAFAQRSAPLTAMQMHTGAIAAKLEGRNQIQSMEYGPFILRKYWTEVEKLVERQPPQQKIFPETWVNAAVYVKGMHAKELSTTENADSPFFSEPVSSGVPPPPAKKEELTEQEMAVVKKMRTTPERYMAQKKNMKVEVSI